MRLAIVGTGYVGLVSGACLADIGHEVICVDNDLCKIAALRGGHIPIYEPGLVELVQRQRRARRLTFAPMHSDSVADVDAVFICVGTPPRGSDGCADLSQVYVAAREIAAGLTGFTVVVTKSTVPVGTGDEIERIIRELRPDAEFSVAANPEFLREGDAIHDFQHPDRIVVGTESERARQVMAEIYAPLASSGAPMLFTGRRTAELIKYAANAFLATKVTFINEIADLCERVGADVRQVASGMGFDRRIGPQFLSAGPGFGGSCFPKDAVALIKTAQEHGSPLRVVETVVAVNEARKRTIARKIATALGGSVRGANIAVLGLTFKPDTDDMREAPSIALITALQDMGACVRAYDPAGMDRAKALLPGLHLAADPYACARNADALVVITEWEQFRALNFARLKRIMARPVLVDLRNLYRSEEITALGFSYEGIGQVRRNVSDIREPLPLRAYRATTLKGPALPAAAAPQVQDPLLHAAKAARRNGSGTPRAAR